MNKLFFYALNTLITLSLVSALGACKEDHNTRDSSEENTAAELDGPHARAAGADARSVPDLHLSFDLITTLKLIKEQNIETEHRCMAIGPMCERLGKDYTLRKTDDTNDNGLCEISKDPGPSGTSCIRTQCVFLSAQFTTAPENDTATAYTFVGHPHTAQPLNEVHGVPRPQPRPAVCNRKYPCNRIPETQPSRPEVDPSMNTKKRSYTKHTIAQGKILFKLDSSDIKKLASASSHASSDEEGYLVKVTRDCFPHSDAPDDDITGDNYVRFVSRQYYKTPNCLDSSENNLCSHTGSDILSFNNALSCTDKACHVDAKHIPTH